MQTRLEKRAEARAEQRELLALAWPCVLENLSSTLVNLVDTAMVGSIGAVASAAVGVCSTPSWLLNGLVFSLGVGGTALVARAVGAGRKDEAEHITMQVFRMVLILAATLAITYFSLANLIPKMMQAKPDVQVEAAAYLRIMTTSYLFHFSGMAMGALLRGSGDTKTPMTAGIMANVLNATGNFLLIYPVRELDLFGFRFTMWGAGMGVRGAAAASAFAMSVAGIYIMSHMLTGRSKLRLRFSFKAPWDMDVVKRVLHIALPAALSRVTVNVGQIIYAAMISSIGTAELAAYQITNVIESMGYMPANGFSQAGTALVGQNLGAGKPQKSMNFGKRAIHTSTLLLTAIGVLLILARNLLAGLFSSDAQVVYIISGMVIICGLVQPFNALSQVTTGCLNGAGDTKAPFLYNLISMWCFRITFSWLLGFKMGFGVYGIYFSMVIDLAVRSTLLYARFHKGKWQALRV